ncbi:MAG: UV DNA damage repair endonuclease UvsE [Spirochaetaceae bacterium]|nr:MAG: UV DNA damage repair endonuclease UvsE [Spirochaetaceae bacterium]
MIRLGLCCIFREQPIKFRRKTAKSMLGLPRSEQLGVLASLCRLNAGALQQALRYCQAHGIGDFRINSQILPLYTHPQLGYRLEELPGGEEIIAAFARCGTFCRDHGLRTSFHPDQFILLSSPSEEVTQRSIAELNYQAELAELVAADVINIHGGGAYGDKEQALARLTRRLQRLRPQVRARLCLENDDRIYTPRDLLPLCLAEGVPFVYDVHHHRCLPDGMEVAEVTESARRTWDREPLFHLSSPRDGWNGKNPCFHHDFIDPADFPAVWLEPGLDLSVEVEAKAKELAVNRLRKDLADRVVLFPDGE